MPPLSFNWSISAADVIIVCSACYAAARTIVHSLRKVLRRMDLHEEALLKSGWLRRNKRTGEIEVPDGYSHPVGK